jgi:hypothetical protein
MYAARDAPKSRRANPDHPHSRPRLARYRRSARAPSTSRSSPRKVSAHRVSEGEPCAGGVPYGSSRRCRRVQRRRPRGSASPRLFPATAAVSYDARVRLGSSLTQCRPCHNDRSPV